MRRAQRRAVGFWKDKEELNRLLQLLVDNAQRHLEREVYDKGR